MKIIQPFSNYFVRFVQAYYPDPFIFAIVLTFIAFVVSLLLTDANMMTAVEAWGGGLSYLMTFTTQIALLLITCHALAHTDHARSLLLAFSRLPKSVFQCYVSVALITSVASLISGSLGLIAGALIAVETAREARKNNIRIHYPLLVASAYAGQQVWHMGYSSSAALMVATQDNPLANIIGGIIPVKETIFSSWNLTIALVSALSIAVFCALMHPGDNEIMEITDSIADKFDHDESDENPEKTDGSFAEKIDNQRLFSFLLGALLAIYIINWFFTRGLDLNLNIVVWTFLCLGLILC